MSRTSAPTCLDNLYHLVMEADRQDSEIARFVKAARTSLKLTQEQLGELYGKTKGNVSAWENGRHEPSHTIIDDIAKRARIPMPGSQKALRTPVRNEPNSDLLHPAEITELIALYAAADREHRKMALKSLKLAASLSDKSAPSRAVNDS
jgi:transcriptional regulator with XRE-family HTH domain